MYLDSGYEVCKLGLREQSHLGVSLKDSGQSSTGSLLLLTCHEHQGNWQ